ncbi:MAG TPA: alpha/beta hydrolase [Acetobacteraceae bacterium]|nr:alpha/beta hydrolase [Acetobacteraceae bacterium]
MPADTQEFTTRDVEYLRHGDRRLMARLFVPRGRGPFPAIVELHGGAWCNGDLNECQTYAEALARGGLAVAALDFRHAGDGYPSSLADINYGIRWVKANAGELNTRADLIGAAGQSSGGHLAMLAAMRSEDPRYTAISLPSALPAVDARLRAVAMLWPVINPLSRYRHALRARDSATPPAWVGNIPDRHDLYWKTEAAMADGNPMLALERGEKVQTPPALWLQGRPDPVHDYHDPDGGFAGTEPERFTAAYRRAGGTIDLRIVAQAERASAATLGDVASFFRKNITP